MEITKKEIIYMKNQSKRIYTKKKKQKYFKMNKNGATKKVNIVFASHVAVLNEQMRNTHQSFTNR